MKTLCQGRKRRTSVREGMSAFYIVFSGKGARGVDILSGSHGLPEAIAVAVTALLHLWRRSTLLSILAGTAVYMVLVQVVFA